MIGPTLTMGHFILDNIQKFERIYKNMFRKLIDFSNSARLWLFEPER